MIDEEELIEEIQSEEDDKPDYKVKVGGGRVNMKGNLKAVHEAHWDAKSYTILAILLTLKIGFISLISYIIYDLIPLTIGLKIVLSVSTFFLLVFLLVIICWWQRYQVLMFIHRLDRKFIAKKTYHGK